MGHREQNSSCPRHRQEIPRGFLTEWEATPLEPTEDAMQNDKAERLAYRLGQLGAILTVHHREYNPAPILENSTRAMTEAAALIHTQAARIAELEANLREMTRRRDEWRKKAEGFDAVRLALREKVGTPWPPHMSRLLWAGIAADEKKRADDAEAEIARLTAALAEAEARTAELVAAAYEAAVEAIEALPRRQEPIGGQMVSYVQIAEAITAIRALAQKEAGE